LDVYFSPLEDRSLPPESEPPEADSVFAGTSSVGGAGVAAGAPAVAVPLRPVVTATSGSKPSSPSAISAPAVIAIAAPSQEDTDPQRRRPGDHPPEDQQDGQRSEQSGEGAPANWDVQPLARRAEVEQGEPGDAGQHDQEPREVGQGIPAAHPRTGDGRPGRDVAAQLRRAAEPVEEEEQEQGGAPDPGDDLARAKP
jgi:hypothetical protein